MAQPMEFRIADAFTDSLARLSSQSCKPSTIHNI
jgi:hypothetical protein